MYISTVLDVAFPPFSLTGVMWICNFVQRRMLTLVCLAVRCRYHKIDKNNQVDVNVVRTFNRSHRFLIHSELLSRYLLCKASIQSTEKRIQPI